MLLKVLISLATVGGVPGAATAITVFTANTENEKSKGADQTSLLEQTKQRPKNEEKREEDPRPETIASEQQRQELQIESKNETKFEGKLVFNKTTKKPDGLVFSNSMTVFYQGELLSEEDYKIKKDKWDKPEPGDSEVEHDPEDHITIELSPEKTQKTESQLKEYLDKVNEKLEKETKDLDRFDKLQKLLEENRSNFEENFGTGSYDEFLKAIKKEETKR